MHCQVNFFDGQTNRVFVLGGQHQTRVLDSVEMFDFSQNKWVEKASMLSPRTVFSALNLDAYIYAFGGFKDEMYYFPDTLIERYDIANDVWEPLEISGLELSSKGGVSVSRAFDGSILILGGVNTQNSYQSFHSYNPYNEECNQLNSQDLGVSMGKFTTSDGNRFRLVGGINDFKFLEYSYKDNLWAVTPSEQEMKSYVGSLSKFANPKVPIFQLIAYSSAVTY